MSWLYVFLVIGAALAIGRIWFSIKKLREQPHDDWDARLIERLRRGGADPFRPLDIDFFLAMPSEDAAAEVARELAAEGFRVDARAVTESTDHPFSVHAIKSMQLNADGIREVSTRMRAVAAARGGRYDGWTASQAGG
jgi:regulator of RNase E activity RraB